MITADAVQPVILAAGLSKRWGEGDKVWAPVAGKPMIAHCLAACTSVFDRKPVIVLGPETRSEIHAVLNEHPSHICRNPDPRRGLASSLRLAARWAENETDAEWLLVLLADMPFVRPDTLMRLLSCDGSPDAIASAHPQPGPPMLWHRRTLKALQGLTGDQGGRSLLRGGAVDVTLVPQPKDDLKDIDRPEDTRRPQPQGR